MIAPVSPATVGTRIRFRRAYAEQWEDANPILRDGEPGFDKTNNMLKVGDGVTPWEELDYLTPPEGMGGSTPGSSDVGEVSSLELAAAIRAHVINQTPHPVYDDGPSLLLLYQNAKV